MIVSSNTGGLANRLKCWISSYRLSQELNTSYKVEWKVLKKQDNVDHYLNCKFDKLFENSNEYLNNEKLDKIIKYDKPFFYLTLNDRLIIQECNYIDNYDSKGLKYTNKMQNPIDHNYLNIPKKIRESLIDSFKIIKLDKYIEDNIINYVNNNFLNRNIISIHIRNWSRNNEESRNKIVKNNYLTFEEEMLKYLDCFYYLSTDSEFILDYFTNKSKVKNRILIYNRKSKLDISREIELGIQEDLIELYLLSKTKYNNKNFIIGSLNSTFTEVAWYLGECSDNIKII